MTSPILPDYVPVPRASLGPAVNGQGYYVGRVERNLYWVTDGDYHSAFLTTRDGVVLFDAPPTIGHNLQRAVNQVAAAEGVSNTVTHLVYTHHHSDHAGGSSIFGTNVVRIGHEECRRLLLRDNDPAKPAPEETFADHRTLEIGGERVELAWHGGNHSPDNIYIHFPDHDTLMLVDIALPGWVPFYGINLSEDVPGYMAAPATALSYPWTLLVAFAAIEARSSHPLLPLRILADRNRSAGYLSAAAVGVIIFAVLYFATLFFQDVWGYSALKSSVAYLPWITVFSIGAAASALLLPRIGPRALMVAGSLFGAGGMYWLSRTGVTDSYLGHVLGAFIIAAFGLSLVSVPFVALALSRVRQADSGEASSVVNVAPLVGGSVGIAALGTVAWTTAAHQIHLTRAGGAAATYRHALATGFDRAFLVAAGVGLAILILAVVLIRVRATGTADQAPPAASPLAGEGQPQLEPNGAAPTTEASPN